MSDSDDFQDEAIDSTTAFNFAQKDSNVSIKEEAVSGLNAPTQELREYPSLLKEREESKPKQRNLSPEIAKYLNAVIHNVSDRESWNALASSICNADVDSAREALTIILNDFPGSSRFVLMRCEVEEKSGNFTVVEKLLQENLMKCMSIDLFIYYCRYYERKLLRNATGPDYLRALDEVDRVYQYAIHMCGHFIDSSVLFDLYHSFLEKYPHIQENPQYTEKCVNSLRNFYHRVIALPIRHVERFWEEYSKFEGKQVIRQEMTAEEKKMAIVNAISHYADVYRNAVDVLKQRETLWKKINLQNFSIRDPSDDDYIQVSLWEQAIAFEQTNPLYLSPDQLHHHLQTTYRRWLACCYFIPSVWMQFIEFEHSYWTHHSPEKADSILADLVQEALSAMPDCTILRLAITDYYEQIGKIDEAIRVYEGMNDGKQSAQGWIAYQQFSRRHRGVKGGREIFRRARLNLVRPELFIAAANMEMDINHQKQSAISIFQAGLAHFKDDESYIGKYATFLLDHGEYSNARLLLENSIERIGKEKGNHLWEILLKARQEYEMRGTTLKELKKDEERFIKASDGREMLQGLMGRLRRYHIPGFEPTSVEDKNLLHRRRIIEQELEFRSKREAKDMAMQTKRMATDDTTPKWMVELAQKLPSAGKDKARATIVQDIVNILSTVKIPRVNNLRIQ